VHKLVLVATEHHRAVLTLIVQTKAVHLCVIGVHALNIMGAQSQWAER
jgi:hypothetical protein